MEYRIGKCSACGAEYKIPASFAHDVARCKVCSGVVHIAPSPGQARSGGRGPRASEPSRTIVPRPARPAATDPAARGEGRDARRTPPPAERRPLTEREEVERAQPAGVPDSASAPSHAPRESPARPAQVAPAASAGAARPQAAPQAPAARADERPRAAPKEVERKPLPVRALVTVGVLLVLAVVAWFFRGRVLGASSTPGGDVSAKENGEAPRAAPAAQPAKDEQASAAGDPEADPRLLADFGPARGTTDAEWERMTGWLATWTDPTSGAEGELAREELVGRGHAALPLLVNRLLRLDLASAAGEEVGRRCVAALSEICGGRSSGWKEGTEPADVASNRQVALDWAALWRRASDDVAYLLEVLALDPASAEAEALRASYRVEPPESSAE